MEYGPEYGVWSMEYRVWSMEYGVWSMEYASLAVAGEPRSMEYGRPAAGRRPRSMEYADALYSLPGVQGINGETDFGPSDRTIMH